MVFLGKKFTYNAQSTRVECESFYRSNVAPKWFLNRFLNFTNKTLTEDLARKKTLENISKSMNNTKKRVARKLNDTEGHILQFLTLYFKRLLIKMLAPTTKMILPAED